MTGQVACNLFYGGGGCTTAKSRSKPLPCYVVWDQVSLRASICVIYLIDARYEVLAFSREKSGVGGKKSMDDVKKDFAGAECVFGDVTDINSIRQVMLVVYEAFSY